MRIRYQSGDKIHEVDLQKHGEHFHAAVDGEAYELEVLDSQPGQVSLRLSGPRQGQGRQTMTVHWAAEAGRTWLSVDGCTYLLEKPTARRGGRAGEPGGSESIRAPMPAQVRAVSIQEGEQVEKGQVLLLLEAMKMEIQIRAPTAGLVTRLLVAAGQAVDKDQRLVEIGG